jgi:hypothetical protein
VAIACVQPSRASSVVDNSAAERFSRASDGWWWKNHGLRFGSD